MFKNNNVLSALIFSLLTMLFIVTLSKIATPRSLRSGHCERNDCSVRFAISFTVGDDQAFERVAKTNYVHSFVRRILSNWRYTNEYS
jgi:hypothetical protein